MAKFQCAVAGVFARLSGEAWFWREWGHMDILFQGVEDAVRRCRCELFCAVLGLLESVQRAEN